MFARKWLCALLVVTLSIPAIALFSTPASAAGWSAPISIGSGTHLDSSNPAIASNAAGQQIVAWTEWSGMQRNVYANRYYPELGWAGAELIGPGFDAAVGIDMYGNATVAWIDGSTIYAERYVPGYDAWDPKTTVSGSGQNPSGLAIAVARDGGAAAVWEDWDGVNWGIFASIRPIGPFWNPPSLIELQSGQADNPQVAIDSAKNVICVFSIYDALQGGIWANRYVPAQGWGAEALIQSQPGYSFSPSLATDRVGNAAAVWVSQSGGQNLLYANVYTVGVGWATSVAIEDQSFWPVSGPDVSLDALGNAIAVWSSGPSGSLRSNMFVRGVGWGIPATIDSAPNDFAPSISSGLGTDTYVAWMTWSPSNDSFVNVNHYNYTLGWEGSRIIAQMKNGSSPSIAADEIGDATVVWSGLSGAWDVFASHYSVSPSPGNQPPIASFFSSTSQLTVNVNAGNSYDTDGWIRTYSWDWGDGNTTAIFYSPLADHSYSAAGTYSIRLIVTDDSGATGTTVQTVSLSPQPPVYGWKAVTIPAGHYMNLYEISTPFGPGIHIDTIGSDDLAYRFMGVRDASHVIGSNGSLSVSGEFLLYDSLPWDYQAGRRFVKLYILDETSTTILADRYILDWNVSLSTWYHRDVTITGLIPGTVVNIGIGRDDMWVIDRDLTAEWAQVVVSDAGPPPNAPPVAYFAMTSLDLTVYVDANASFDPDGTIVSYRWSWGDGTSSPPMVTPSSSHEYAAAGTYYVSLTVTDNAGMTGSYAAIVTVTAPHGLPGSFSDILVDDSRSLLYASDTKLGALVVIDRQTDRPINTVFVGQVPQSLALSNDGSELFVALAGDRAIAVVDLDSMLVSRYIKLSIAPSDIAVGRPGRLYVGSTEQWGYPVIVDTVANKEIAKIRQGGLVLGNSIVKTSPDGRLLYIGEQYMWPGAILKYSIATDKVNFLGSSPFDMFPGLSDMAVGPDGYLYVPSGFYTTSVIDSSTWTIVKSVPDPIGSYKIVLAQDGKIILGTSMDDPVSAVDVSTGQLLMSSSFTQRAVVIATDKGGSVLYGITETSWGSDIRIEKIVTGIPQPVLPVVTGTMTVYGKSREPAQMNLTVDATGTWWAEVRDCGLAGVTIKVYDTTNGTSVKIFTQGVMFKDRHSVVNSFNVTLYSGHTYLVTGESIGRYPGSAVIIGLFLGTPSEKPIAAFTTLSMSTYTVSVDASASFDPDGLIEFYQWLWGDGNSSTGLTASHTYVTIGLRTITLTVTDDDGLSASLTKSLPVPPFLVFGYTRDSYGEPVPGCSVTVTDLRTGAPLSTVSDVANATYMVDLNTIVGGWQIGDVVRVTATKDTIGGWTDAVLSENLPFLQVDVTLGGPLPQLIVFGYTYNVMAQSLSGSIVKVSDLSTGGSTSLTSDANGLFQGDLNEIPGGWQAGDVIRVWATWGMLGEIRDLLLTIENTDGGSIQMDVVLRGGPPPPLSLFGYTYGPDGLPLYGSAVTATDLRTGEHLLTTSDAVSGFYGIDDLTMLPGGWMLGDTIRVTVTKGTLSGSAEAVIVDVSVPYLQLDVTLS